MNLAKSKTTLDDLQRQYVAAVNGGDTTTAQQLLTAMRNISEATYPQRFQTPEKPLTPMDIRMLDVQLQAELKKPPAQQNQTLISTLKNRLGQGGGAGVGDGGAVDMRNPLLGVN